LIISHRIIKPIYHQTTDTMSFLQRTQSHPNSWTFVSSMPAVYTEHQDTVPEHYVPVVEGGIANNRYPPSSNTDTDTDTSTDATSTNTSTSTSISNNTNTRAWDVNYGENIILAAPQLPSAHHSGMINPLFLAIWRFQSLLSLSLSLSLPPRDTKFSPYSR